MTQGPAAWRWVPIASVYGAHARGIERFGGAEGVRDAGLLESALARPQNLSAYKDPTAFELAAEYAFGLVKNHPFVDGNKRTSFVTYALFLALNGWRLAASEAEATATMLALAAGEIGEEEFGRWLEVNCDAA